MYHTVNKPVFIRRTQPLPLQSTKTRPHFLQQGKEEVCASADRLFQAHVFCHHGEDSVYTWPLKRSKAKQSLTTYKHHISSILPHWSLRCCSGKGTQVTVQTVTWINQNVLPNAFIAAFFFLHFSLAIQQQRFGEKNVASGVISEQKLFRKIASLDISKLTSILKLF